MAITASPDPANDDSPATTAPQRAGGVWACFVREVEDTLVRTGHVWLENPLTIVTFIGRLIAAIPAGVRAFRTRAGAARASRRLIGQFLGTLLRGVVLVGVLGLAGGLAVGTLARAAGSFFLPLIEGTVLPILVRDLAPLGLAVALAARMGASISTQLAVLPAQRHLPVVIFNARELNRRAVPHVVAGFGTAPLLFLVMGACLLTGYEAFGSVRELARASPARFFTPAVWPPLVTGAIRAMGFGGVVSIVACALGVYAAEHYDSDTGERIEVNQAVWESSAISVVICAVYTIVFLKTAGQG
ncbi:MAG TPA: ABC transporter permease [Longimicrobiaceae bacterium]|nr:ABC transporter permease [Longimicrobiaceae bacterium]